jgi:hypothetical protein
MAVNPLNPAIPYSINASNETSDNSRQRQEENSARKNLKDRPKINRTETSSSPSTSSDESSNGLQNTELTSQIVDSGTVIELLAHRPKLKRSVRNCFSTKKLHREKSQITDVKKFNKAF